MPLYPLNYACNYSYGPRRVIIQSIISLVTTVEDRIRKSLLLLHKELCKINVKKFWGRNVIPSCSNAFELKSIFVTTNLANDLGKSLDCFIVGIHNRCSNVWVCVCMQNMKCESVVVVNFGCYIFIFAFLMTIEMQRTHFVPFLILIFIESDSFLHIQELSSSLLNKYLEIL